MLKALHAAFDHALQLPEVREKIRATGAAAVGNSPADFEAFMANERQRLGEVVSKARIRLAD